MKTVSIKYKKLPKHIKHQNQGYDYSLIKRKGNIAWYEARYLNGNETQGYVVIKIRRVGTKILPDGKVLEPREIFPAPKDFGRDGWFYMAKSRSLAENHFNALGSPKAKEAK